MKNLLPRALSLLLLGGLWATGAAAQTATARLIVDPAAGRTASAPAVTARASARPSRCGLRVRSLQSRGSKRFFATRILDLDFVVRLRPSAAGTESVRVEVETPSGHLFQTLTVPFTDEPAQAASRRAMAGFPHPVEVQFAQPSAAAGRVVIREVVGRMPVAGTPIVHSSLYGEWRARAYLDDAIEPCSVTKTFEIRP